METDLFSEFTNLNLHRKRMATSPAAATLILVTITIGLAIAIVFWSSGSINVLQTSEKVDMILSAEPAIQPGTFKLEIQMRNIGTRNATLRDIYFNSNPIAAANITQMRINSQSVNQTLPLSFSLPIDTVSMIEAELGLNYHMGQALEVLLVTEAGSQIRKVIYLQ